TGIIVDTKSFTFRTVKLKFSMYSTIFSRPAKTAIMAALGMFAGYCGTLLTPMAANFNIVPAMLLELKDKNAVIKAQVPIALSIFIINMFIMYGLVYRF
ncbi:5-oxoproline transporter, DUF979 family subunit, partial [Bacillus toyonensis]|uniref:5-oxoproline transporter, DUF979 family subunit n=1 Tax=Bacillus toyonensis TaxID=155322 RepID=UPI002FFE7E76